MRYGEATEDVNHARDLVAKVQALPAQTRKDYRLTDAVIPAPALTADIFDKADDAQTDAKAAPRLATLALPKLLRRLSAALRLTETLLKGQRTDTDPKFKWAELYAAFAGANKRRGAAVSARRVTGGPRIVRTLPVTTTSNQPLQLVKASYGPAYTLTVKNRSASPCCCGWRKKTGLKRYPWPVPPAR